MASEEHADQPHSSTQAHAKTAQANARKSSVRAVVEHVFAHQKNRFGLFIPLRPLGWVEMAYLGGVVVAGFLIGLIPAWKAYRNTLADGLSVRV